MRTVLDAENIRLTVENNRLAAENNRLAAENTRLAADAKRLRAKLVTKESKLKTKAKLAVARARLVTADAELAAAKTELAVKVGVSRLQGLGPVARPASTMIEIQLGGEGTNDGVREIVSGLSAERKQEIKGLIDAAAAEVLTRYDITWESRRAPMEAILKEMGIILFPPVCYTDKTPFETTHDGAYLPVHTIATRIELYLLGLRQRSGGDGEFYYSAEVYKILCDVYRLL